jgi:hypothetical protein
MGIAINTEMQPYLNQDQIPEAESLTANQEPEPPCSQGLKNKLAHDGKKVYKIKYLDKRGAKHVANVTATDETNAREKFEVAFGRALVSRTAQKRSRWDDRTEPTVYSEEEFAFHSQTKI